MNKVIATENKPIKMWVDGLDGNTLIQAKNLANLPFLFKHVALMPDAHMGYGMPIGGVIATRDVVIPNAVGVDIGCGMCAIKTSLIECDTRNLKKIRSLIQQVIPVGPKLHNKKQKIDYIPDVTLFDDRYVVHREFENAQMQVGTLGGGNHFIEIQQDTEGYIWIMIHSGSRNLGFKVANYYNKLAVELNAKWFSSVPKKWELAFLPINEVGTTYLKEMQYCVDFALANRELMMERVRNCFLDVIPDVKFGELINIAHNYASIENHFNTNVIVHRKGATRAYKGQLGIIPGSQGTNSYIVKGKGNTQSFKSCSHGAGRLMGRKQAKKELNLEYECGLLNKKGILHSISSADKLDEAPGAYKDIIKVMILQEDLVDIVTTLTPLAVIKS